MGSPVKVVGQEISLPVKPKNHHFLPLVRVFVAIGVVRRCRKNDSHIIHQTLYRSGKSLMGMVVSLDC